ncbi:hypothetical protein ABZ686_00190 [Streptomyces sp. NPDC006992]|uniref:Eco57I restriction-modification methylase domain-containing protein n=1 Tax=Streptomyces sp. NPDC006992 TaxID=3155601 RepID=UPI0033CCA31C
MSPRRPLNRGLAAAKAKAADGRGQHQEWLDLTEVSGPFLTMPVLLGAWPQLDTLEKDERTRLRARHADWQTDPTAGRDEWIAYVLSRLLGWDDALTLRPGQEEHAGLDRLTLRVAEHNTEVRADFALAEPGTDLAAEPDVESAAKRVRLLGMTVPSGTAPTARAAAGGDWSAAPADRLARLLRHHGIPLGLVTDGRWWCLVWAPVGGVTTTAVFDAIGWNEAAERNVVRAFVSLLCRRRFFEYDEPETLVGLLKASLAAGEDVTEALGVQVRQAVELLVDAIGRADVRAMDNGAPGLHASGVPADEVYRGAVAVMMRVVFLLFAEERGLLPADNEIYAASYSARFLRDDLKKRADDEGEPALEHTTSAWHRLIALFHAVHGGVDHPASGFHLPAYDGSIFDPDTYPWLERTTPLLPIDDRTVLHMLQAVQEVRVGKGKHREVRTLSFRALDVEQIGYVYEGLLSYDGRRATEHMVGLIGPEGLEHEVPLRELEALAAKAGGTAKPLAKAIHEKWKDPKPPATVSQLEKRLAPLEGSDAEEARRRLNAVTKDAALTERLLPFVGVLRDDLRGLPLVIPNGTLYVTESSLRKNTGTHYTPRFLAEEVVLHALEPLVYEPGPLQTADTEQWRLKTADQILELKVADVAMGSAAFLVAACRYLADRLIEAWELEGRAEAMAYRAGRAVDAVTAADAEQDPVVVEARRQIIEHCLYGVDINPMAVEMAKLSLWLVSMDPDRPFTFLDDRLVAGDSLLGVTSLDQLEAVHLDVEKGDLIGSAAEIDRLVAAVAEERRAITEIAGKDLESVAEKRWRLAKVREHTDRLRLIGDLVAGAALATCASGRVAWYERGAGDGEGERLRDLFPAAAGHAGRIAPGASGESDPEAVRAAELAAGEWLASELPEGAPERAPLHWPLEFPEVFLRGGGFDAIVGNPPFLGGTKISGPAGVAYRQYLAEYLAGFETDRADLAAFFIRRCAAISSKRGTVGVVATHGVTQGVGARVGLAAIKNSGWEIYRGRSKYRWPTQSASVYIVQIHAVRGGASAKATLDGRPASGITEFMSPLSRSTWNPMPLFSNMNLGLQGSKPSARGFILDEGTAASMLAADPVNIDVVRPYLTGSDLYGSADCGARRSIINFQDWPEERASLYVMPFEFLRQRIPHERKGSSEEGNPNWWQFGRPAIELYRRISPLGHVISFAYTSKTMTPVRTLVGPTFGDSVVVIPIADFDIFALLSSNVHYWWAIVHGTSMKNDPRYQVPKCFETFSRPARSTALENLGRELDAHRSNLMQARDIGLTATYNLVHDEACQDADIVELRRLHTEIDRATIEAYGWHDLLDETGETPPADPTHQTVPLEHGFHDTDQGPRYTIGLLARTEIIDRLRQLNHQAYADEVFLGLHKKPVKHPDMPKPSAEAIRKRDEQLASRGDGVDFGEAVEDGLF